MSQSWHHSQSCWNEIERASVWRSDEEPEFGNRGEGKKKRNREMNDRSSSKPARVTRSMRDIDDWSGNEPKRPSSSTGYGMQQIPSICSTNRNEEESRTEDEGEKKNTKRRRIYIFEGKRSNDIRPNELFRTNFIAGYLRQVVMTKPKKYILPLSLSPISAP